MGSGAAAIAGTDSSGTVWFGMRWARMSSIPSFFPSSSGS
jgi:hypothetical protein